MKISEISKLVTFVLIIVLIGFGVAVSWSLNHLNKAFGMVEFFGQQKDKIYIDLNQPIFNYLQSGDTTLLTEIEHNLEKLQNNIQANDALANEVKNTLIQLLNEIQQSALPELTAAGKLAEPQMLLINNEQQLSAHYRTLLAYVEKAGTTASSDQRGYLLAIGQAQSALQTLSRARQSYFLERKQASADNIQNYLK